MLGHEGHIESKATEKQAPSTSVLSHFLPKVRASVSLCVRCDPIRYQICVVLRLALCWCHRGDNT